MNSFKARYWLNSKALEIEFFIISCWLLFFIQKRSAIYYLVFSIILILATIIRLTKLKSIPFNKFEIIIFGFNIMLVFCSIFSVHPIRSILFVVDIIVISIYFVFLPLQANNIAQIDKIIRIQITITSFANILYFAFFKHKAPVSLFFANPILQGIASGFACLLFLHLLFKKIQLVNVTLLVMNYSALVLSQSKAAFGGVLICAAYMTWQKSKKKLLLLLAILVISLIPPSPLTKAIVHSIKYDPYTSNRLDIWKVSLKMFIDHPIVGVSPDLFEEMAPQYKFPATKGPARFNKLAESPHNDYLKIVTENGIFGVIFLMIVLCLIVKAYLAKSKYRIEKYLFAYLLIQMIFFNFIFQAFFYFLLIYISKILFEKNEKFILINKIWSNSFILFLISIWLVFYLLQSFSTLLNNHAQKTNYFRSFNMLSTAELIDPLNSTIPNKKALIILNILKRKPNCELFIEGIQLTHTAQKLNKLFVESYILESQIFSAMTLNNKYQDLSIEILSPVLKAEKLDPKNPFIKLGKAIIYLEFGLNEQAKQSALQALALEPEYISALFFLHNNFSYISDKMIFKSNIEQILEKHKEEKWPDNSYMKKLLAIPPEIKK